MVTGGVIYVTMALGDACMHGLTIAKFPWLTAVLFTLPWLLKMAYLDTYMW